jgi:hypothetical protein
MIIIQIWSEEEKHEGQNGRQNGSTLRKSANSNFIAVISNYAVSRSVNFRVFGVAGGSIPGSRTSIFVFRPQIRTALGHAHGVKKAGER